MGDVASGSENVGPVFEELEAMVRSARNAFNRHSRADLEELRRIHRQVDGEIGSALKQAATAQEKSLLTRLKSIADNLGGLADPLEKKIKGGILFSDKAVSQSNFLFDRQAGLLRTLLDITKTDNEVLKNYAAEEGQKLIERCRDYATEHEARLIEGVCLPQAAPIFLGLLDRMRAVTQNGLELVGSRAAKP